MNKTMLRTLMILLGLSGIACAANYDDPIDGIYRGTYGDTVTVEVPSLVAKSPVTGDQNGNLTFQINAATGYRNFNQLTDLKNGDPVEIQYTQDATAKDKGMIASTITRENPSDTATANPVNADNGATVVTDTTGTGTPTVTQTTVTTTTGAQ